ncbi:single-stranded DNA-binding protein [Candidatus Sumerlaeota bacterium]|nr:single-stranded DNA-binding protein [Candidatus Sumerlaeota bacterium]
MASVNRVIVTGHLVSDIDLKSLPSGTSVAKLRVAVNTGYKDKSGEWQDDTCFIDVDVWGKQAEWLAESAHKGSKVLVEGSLREDKWEDREGNKRSKIKIRAFHAEHMSEPRGRGAGRAAPEVDDTSPSDSGPADEVDDDLPF